MMKYMLIIFVMVLVGCRETTISDGQRVWVDSATGCEYFTYGEKYITPRSNNEGKHKGCTALK